MPHSEASDPTLQSAPDSRDQKLDGRWGQKRQVLTPMSGVLGASERDEVVYLLSRTSAWESWGAKAVQDLFSSILPSIY